MDLNSETLTAQLHNATHSIARHNEELTRVTITIEVEAENGKTRTYAVTRDNGALKVSDE